MDTLVDLLGTMPGLGDREALRYSNGYRFRQYSYRQLYGRIGAFAAWLDREGFRRGDRLMLWGENSPEWVVVFWGCVARGVLPVPVDVQSSPDFVARIQRQVQARVLVCGDACATPEGCPPVLRFHRVESLGECDFTAHRALPDEPVELVYTSGTTGEPAGVMHRHRNICANLRPIAREMEKYRSLARPFQPVRTLNLLPLSHLFGQSLGLFVPLLLGGAVMFQDAIDAASLLEAIRKNRISVLVAVPRLMTTMEKELRRRFDLNRAPGRWRGKAAIFERWWRYRAVHRLTGWKFWALVVGGARLEPEAEAFWLQLGYLVIQGYGLTETSPVVALNHPFHARAGSIGKPLPGQEVRLAEDGEILVRGENVVAERLSPDGWLHTGDIGEMDSDGRLYFKGRKKEIIVTSEGLNVYPQDVERVLNALPGVRESVVVPMTREGQEVVHAALILREPVSDVEALVRQANRTLEPHQRIRSWSVWPAEEFPRTGSTGKVKRAEVAAVVAGHKPSASAGLDEVLVRITGRQMRGDERLEDDLGLSSLDRVELLSELETRYGVRLDEDRFTRLNTVDEVKALVRAAESGEAPVQDDRIATPRWSRSPLVRWSRMALLEYPILPLFQFLAFLEVQGVEHLDSVQPPVIFAANHLSDLDTLCVFQALPFRWRHKLAPAMGMEYFRAWFEPGRHPWLLRMRLGLEYVLACWLFNGYLLPRRWGGVRRGLQYTGELIDAGYCPLVYPEGKRSLDGAMNPFQPGIGVMATRLRCAIVPVHLRGTFEIYNVHRQAAALDPQPGPVRVRFGKPMRFEAGADPAAVALEIEEAVRSLAVP